MHDYLDSYPGKYLDNYLDTLLFPKYETINNQHTPRTSANPPPSVRKLVVWP